MRVEGLEADMVGGGGRWGAEGGGSEVVGGVL